jgi:RiboL-PSP-HEPN
VLKAPPKIVLPQQGHVLTDAAKLYELVHAAVSNMLAACASVKDENLKQDTLRAAFVMSCSGLEAVLKRSFEQSLWLLFHVNDATADCVRLFVDRRLRDDSNRSNGKSLLARALFERNPREFLVGEYTRELVADSLQSSESLRKALESVGLKHQQLLAREHRLDDAFRIRNRIIHEFDVPRGQVVRTQRGDEELKEHIDGLLTVAHDVVQGLVKQIG